jgi:hypothetical protein
MNQQQRIQTVGQYGNVLLDSSEIAKQRGTGNFNWPPTFMQSTYRGQAMSESYPIYVDQQNNGKTSTGLQKPFLMTPEAVNVKDLSLAHFNTPDSLSDDLRRRAYSEYVIGSTGLHPDAEGPGWSRPEFEGADNQYVVWAQRSMQLTPNTLLTYFFSKENIKYIQDRTIEEIYRIRGKDINPQSIDELLIIMRNKYLYALNGWLPQENARGNKVFNRGDAPCSLESRLTRLNKSTLEETVKQVLSGIDQYEQYTKDISSLPMPLEHPVFTTMKGGKTLSESLGYNSGHERTLASNSFNMRYNII